jgi:SAM-dependent methyltransferase
MAEFLALDRPQGHVFHTTESSLAVIESCHCQARLEVSSIAEPEPHACTKRTRTDCPPRDACARPERRRTRSPESANDARERSTPYRSIGATPRSCSVLCGVVDEVAPDGSPIAVYLRLPPGGTPELVHSAMPQWASILELGCGVGRITHPLVRLGHEVVAVDNSAAMLRHVRGARTVLSDIETLELGERFDSVVLASNLINTAEPDRRRALLAVCKAHARSGGVVLIERYEPRWARDLSDESREVEGIKISFHDVRHDGDLLHAAVTYEIDGQSWTQPFTAEIVNDDRLLTESERAGLMFDSWIDTRREWARLLA